MYDCFMFLYRYMLRNSMGACAMVQVPRTPMGRGLGAGAAGGCGGGGAMRVGSAGGGAAAGGMFYPMTFSPPAPRFVYSPAPIAATPTAVPVYPAPHPGAYYDQSMSMSMSKRSPEQVGSLSFLNFEVDFVDLLCRKLWAYLDQL